MKALRDFVLVASLAMATGCAGYSTTALPLQPGSRADLSMLRFRSGLNVVVDGSFETPKVPSGSYNTYSNHQKIMKWSVVGKPGNVAVVSDTFQFDGYTFSAACGHQSLDLTGTTNSRTGVQQSIKTAVGATYRLSFDVGNAYGSGSIGTTSTVLAFVAGKRILKAENTNGKGLMHIAWESFSTKFTATSTLTRVKFINGDPVGDAVNGLDCVRVTQT